jgi:methylenetetrahydrofolate reductase (NADPH)
MNLQRLAARPGPQVSFEFFPPKSAEMEAQLWASIRRLEPLQPKFVSVTYGAGGSTRDRTHHTVKRILDETKLEPAAHLTCVGASKAEVDAVIHDYWNAGVRHIVALRGDMPNGEPYRAHSDGHQKTAELVAAIRAIAPFEVSVSAYPERHPDSPSFQRDIDILKAKIDAGATRAITQVAFESEMFVRLRDRLHDANVNIPLVPGLMPTTNFTGVVRMMKRCGTTIPVWLASLYEGLEHDHDSRVLIASAVMVDQVRLLSNEGFDQFHFYTLNQAELTYAVCRILGIKPAPAFAAEFVSGAVTA